jgi:hypothetical protein
MILFMIMNGIEPHWVIGYVQKISAFDAPACLQYRSSLHANFVGKNKPKVSSCSVVHEAIFLYISAVRGLHYRQQVLLYLRRECLERNFWVRSFISFGRRRISAHAPRFWLEAICQYAGEHSDTFPHRMAVGKISGLFRGRGTPI